MTHPIPRDALDDRLAFVGNSGSGKTYAAGTAVERLLSSSARVVIPDPLGVWWGLNLGADGKQPSAFREKGQLVVFGGPRGDLPLTEHAGKLIGETVAGMKESCILDLSQLGRNAAERRFMLAFLTALYASKTPEPLHVVFDEADMWAPQRVLDKEGDAMKLLGMMETICRRGRVKGFIPWLISQRPAVISKNVLSQVDGLVAFKLTSVQDRDAIGDWVEGQADKAQWRGMWADMATLDVGRGVVWIPARGILKTAQFPAKTTFDSSRAPKRGERATSAGALKPLNLDKVKERLAAVEAESKAADPKALRADIAKLRNEKAALEKQMAAAIAAKAVADPDAIEKAEKRGFEQASKKLENASRRALIKAKREAFTSAAAELAKFAKTLGDVVKGYEIEDAALAIEFTPAAPIPRTVPGLAPQKPSSAKPATVPAALRQTPAGDDTLTGAQRKILRALATWRALGHEAPSREMVAAIAGYPPSSGGFKNPLGALNSAGLIRYPAPGFVALATEDAEGPASQEEARQTLIGNLTGAQRKIVGSLVNRGTRSRDDVANDAGYPVDSGGFKNPLGALRTLGIIDYPQPGFVTMTDWAQQLLADCADRLAA